MTGSSMPVPQAMDFLWLSILSDSMKVFVMSRTLDWGVQLHEAIMHTKGQNQLLALACLGHLCATEFRCGEDAFARPEFCCRRVLKDRSFSYILPAYRQAVQELSMCSDKVFAMHCHHAGSNQLIRFSTHQSHILCTTSFIPDSLNHTKYQSINPHN